MQNNYVHHISANNEESVQKDWSQPLGATPTMIDGIPKGPQMPNIMCDCQCGICFCRKTNKETHIHTQTFEMKLNKLCTKTNLKVKTDLKFSHLTELSQLKIFLESGF